MASFRLDEVYHITGVGIIAVGQVLEGTITKNMGAQLHELLFIVKTLEANHHTYKEARPGITVGLHVQVKPLAKLDDQGSFWSRLFSQADKHAFTKLQKHKGRILHFH